MDWITFLTPYPIWIKLTLTVGVVCLVAAGIGMIFTPTTKTKAESTGGDVNIISNNQRGGITAHTVNDNRPR